MATGQDELPLTGAQRAAIIITSLGAEGAAAIFHTLPDEDVAAIATAGDTLDKIPAEVRQKALNEFHAKLRGDSPAALDLRVLLEQSMGPEKAALVLAKAHAAKFGGGCFQFLNTLDARQCFDILKDERQQTLALVLCHLDSARAADVLGRFESEVQTQIIARIGRLQPVSSDVLGRIAAALQGRVSAQRGAVQASGGAKRVAEVLAHLDRTMEKTLLETLQNKDGPLADDVKRLMMDFDDLVALSQKSIQIVLREIDNADLCLALKGASVEMRKLVFSNLSTRAAERLQEEMELQGPKPRKEVEEARQRVLAVVRRLEEEGKIQLVRASEEGELVA